MDSALRNTCEKFIANRDLLRESFKREGIAMHLMGAAVMTGSGGGVSLEDLKKCEEYLDTKAGVFSSIRGILKMPMIVNMALSSNKEEYYESVQMAYGDIKENRRTRDERFFLAAMIIASAAGIDEEIPKIVEKAGRIFELTDAAGRFFADMTCFVTASSIAAGGDDDVDSYAERFSRCKEELRLSSGIGKVPEDLCMLLAAKGGDIKALCARVIDIANALGDKNISLGSGEAASMLAVLTSLDMTASEIAGHAADASAYLKEQKGFGFMGVGSETRNIYACMLTSMAFSDESKAGDVVSGAGLEDAMESRFIAHQNMMMQSNMIMQQNLLMTTMINTININNITDARYPRL